MCSDLESHHRLALRRFKNRKVAPRGVASALSGTLAGRRWALIACALSQLLCTSVPAPIFFTIAEAYSSAGTEIGIEASYRLFSGPDLSETICPRLPAPVRLSVPSSPLRMTVGEPFRYAQIVILAVGSDGQVIPGVPLQLLAEDADPPFIDTLAEALAGSQIKPSRPGTARFKASTLCGPEEVSAVFSAIIEE